MNHQADPVFSDPAAERVWATYFRDVDRRLRRLSATRRRDIRDELVAHVLDGLDAEDQGSETQRLDSVLRRMGPPGEYLDRYLEDADGPGEAAAGWRLASGLAGVGRRFALAASYVIGLWALLLALAKPLWPEQIGLFLMPSGWWVAGYVEAEGAVEMLGYWLIPLALVLVGIFWILLPRRLGRR